MGVPLLLRLITTSYKFHSLLVKFIIVIEDEYI